MIVHKYAIIMNFMQEGGFQGWGNGQPSFRI